MAVGVSSRDIDELHPAVARGFRELIRRMAEKGQPPVGVNQTFRDALHQDWLFGQGRPNEPHGRAGAIVTNARGGRSIHQYRLAFDIHRNVPGRAFADRTPEERLFWDTAGALWVKMGGVWGGNWQGFVDRPHFEYTAGLSLSELQAGRRLTDDALMPWEEVMNIRFDTVVQLEEQGYGWAVPTVMKLVGNGIIKGDGGGLGLTEDMLRMLVWNDRAGLYAGLVS